ncbi:MAG: pyridoxal phosphate-dependent aminotransferase [Candidatus Omnitrophica bacterium]|nr:pyridoxal phosphate-dependent aminotransferase [Candidatus Omnitrophota bacterium]MCM8825492.1 pyridoxal phosphate-dependent aminotransferase [Candidatus Omnitrophota bacterium]
MIEEKISVRARGIKPSSTLAVNKKAAELAAAGEKVINLSVGEPDFDTPDHIKQACIKAINDGFTKYTDSSGIKPLRQAICEKFKMDNGLDYEPDQIVVSCGAKHSLFNVMIAICDEDDEIIIPAPYWVSYPEMVKLAGGKCIFCRFNSDYKIDIEHLKSIITKKTKALILNSPANPTGIVYTKEELEKIAEIACENNIIVISDEVYEKLVYDGKKHISIASLNDEIKKLTVVVNGVSKTYAMTGWRIGYLATEIPLAKAIANIQSQTTSNPTSFVQKAAMEAILADQAPVRKMVEEFEKRRNYIIKNISPFIRYCRPDGAFYLFLKIGQMTSTELAQKLLTEEKLATVPGDDFGAEGYIRISFACSMENIKEAISRLNRFAERIRK